MDTRRWGTYRVQGSHQEHLYLGALSQHCLSQLPDLHIAQQPLGF